MNGPPNEGNIMMQTPEEIELLEFFECEPVEREYKDGLYVYELMDQNATKLIFSFNTIEGSIQARLLVQGNEVALFSQEGATRIKVENDLSGQYLRCQFDIEATHSDVQVHVKPLISVKWASMLSER